MPGKENIPAYFKPHNPHNCRRASWHNYKAPGWYMITISKHPEAASFSSIVGDLRDSLNPPRCLYSTSGSIIETEILNLNSTDTFEIPNFVIMPDHIHILWRVKTWFEKDFGYYVGLFKSRCTRNCRYSCIPQQSDLFLPKFNDRISLDDEMTRRLNNYITDNPKRRLMVMTHPELFSRACRIRILDREMDVYGNFQLLKHPLIAPAVVSSRYSGEEKKWHEKMIEEAIRTKGVLISPFISRAEKELMQRGIEEGASIIRILPDGIGDRYKPSGKEFELCSQGRCLHIGEPRRSDHKEKRGRSDFLALNNLAHWLASHPTNLMHLLFPSR